MSGLVNGFKLSPDLWKNGNFPSIEEYYKILKRGVLLYSLDVEGTAEPITPEDANRPMNLLYVTFYKGFSRPSKTVLGPGRNEWLLEHIDEYKDFTEKMHSAGIPILVYQNDCNFDRLSFDDDEIKAMTAELDPFVWAFGSKNRTFACLNKPGWRNYLRERLAIRVGKTGADGVFLDNNTPFIHCRCEVCQKLYKDHCGGDLLADMGNPTTVVADMRVFDYVGAKQIPKDMPRLDDLTQLRYQEWRTARAIDFYKSVREMLEEELGRKVIYTANGHVAIAEQSAIQIEKVFDMHFTEDGYTAPPVSNKYNIRLGTAMGEGIRSEYTLTRTMESEPTSDMVSALEAEGRANGGNGEFWDFVIRNDDRLLKAVKTMRTFFVEHMHDIFAVEKDATETAVMFSWRSDLWVCEPVSSAKHAAGILEDLNLSYDIIFAERETEIANLGLYKLVIIPSVEIMPDVWFNAIQKYLDDGGTVISTGASAEYDDKMNKRSAKWSGANYIHFEKRLDKEYSKGRKEISMHSWSNESGNEYTDAVRQVLKDVSYSIEPVQPLFSIHHTTTEQADITHIVNRYVNVFPHSKAVVREGFSLKLKPAKPISRVEWLTPESAPLNLSFETKDGATRIILPKIRIYGIVKAYYK